VPDVRAAARAAGLAIEFADLGAWGATTLVAEYDPAGPLVRINVRALPQGAAIRAFVDRAVAHELYHHAEATGTVTRLATRRAREGAATAMEDRP
jgi:hypothetical protein